MTQLSAPDCPLCRHDADVTEIWRNDKLRVIEVNMAGYPGYMRVIWENHVAEMSELAPADRSLLMQVVCLVEEVLRATLAPAKINLAALGNMVPHLHWHVIARWQDDPHFPDAIWAAPRRAIDDASEAARRSLLPACRQALADRLRAQFPAR